ncbi:hypothetical protein ACSLBF_12390 [Pseudoalteromonas sp. T1lg65]|uniref:hypothetical protein n=1 Tax=Pseudoalteromonas sp. T1lg65 TaxID=2077101 RepID=UPI003F79B4C9
MKVKQTIPNSVLKNVFGGGGSAGAGGGVEPPETTATQQQRAVPEDYTNAANGVHVTYVS